jgi:hypothetical protein
MKINLERMIIMKENIKMFWNEHKEDIKTGAILVLTPIAVIGVMGTKGLLDMTNFLSNASDEIKNKK